MQIRQKNRTCNGLTAEIIVPPFRHESDFKAVASLSDMTKRLNEELNPVSQRLITPRRRVHDPGHYKLWFRRMQNELICLFAIEFRTNYAALKKTNTNGSSRLLLTIVHNLRPRCA